jgi:hypothetical protein
MTTFSSANTAAKRRLTGLAMAVCLGSGIALAGAATPAAASTVIYDFVGTCPGCMGMGVGEVVLQNFTPGQALTAANFVSFSFTTSFGQVSINASQLTSFGGLLDPANMTGAWLKIGEDGQTFESTGTSFWEVMSSLNGSSIGGGGGGGGGRQGRDPDSGSPSPPTPQFDSFGSDDTDSVNNFSVDFVQGANGGVPEPAVWTLMIGGFAGVGGILRSRKRRPARIEIA